MIDIVIPLGTGSKHDNIEIQYCLKSIETHLTRFDKIYIIGEDPGEIHGLAGRVIHIPAKDHGFNIQDNIRRKIEVACQHNPISENFFFTNDDHIYLKPHNVCDTPYYYNVDLDLAYKRKRKKGSYKYATGKTKDVLEEKGYPTYHFDIHVPIIYNKKLFPEVMAQYRWATERWGYVIKSLYCNTLKIKGEEMGDMQIGFPCESITQIEDMVKDRFVFSFNSQGLNEVMLDYLHSLFPEVRAYTKNQ